MERWYARELSRRSRLGSAVKKVVRELKTNGIIILGKPKIVIQNIVASANLHGKIDLETAADIMDNVMYEPEQFPGSNF